MRKEQQSAARSKEKRNFKTTILKEKNRNAPSFKPGGENEM
jgi:hypothetical protein